MHIICTIPKAKSSYIRTKKKLRQVRKILRKVLHTLRNRCGLCFIWCIHMCAAIYVYVYVSVESSILLNQEVFHMTWIFTRKLPQHSTKSSHTKHCSQLCGTHTLIQPTLYQSSTYSVRIFITIKKCKVDWNKSAWGINEFRFSGCGYFLD